MAGTISAPNTLRDPGDTTTSSMATINTASLFGNKHATPDGEVSTNKRKLTDPNLEIITMDKMYDLTLIVGTPEHPNGQKAFRVNKSALRFSSEVWARMLDGKWAESEMSEIPFPDDSCNAFFLILRVAHLQFRELPTSLTEAELVDLAMLTDKYDLGEVARVAVKIMEWARLCKGSEWTNINLQDLMIITGVFEIEEEYRLLINRLAVNIEFENGSYFYSIGKGQRVQLRSNIPPKIPDHLENTRTTILDKILHICKSALTIALNKGTGKCGDKTCPIKRIGVMMKGFQYAKLYPLPQDALSMPHSIVFYWTALEKMGKIRAAGCFTDDLGSELSYGCFGDFGIIEKTRAVLERYGHKDEASGRNGRWKSSYF